VLLRADSGFIYIPTKKAKGTDSFSYLAQDVSGVRDLATVSIQLPKAKKHKHGKGKGKKSPSAPRRHYQRKEVVLLWLGRFVGPLMRNPATHIQGKDVVGSFPTVANSARSSMMQAQAFDGISRDLGQVATRRSMTRLLGGVAALATMAVAGRGDAEAKKRKSKKAKRGASGPAGPGGATGEAGAPGAPGASLSFGTTGGDRSAVLGATVGSEVESIVECGPGSAPISCDWTYIGNADAFDRTTTQVGSGSFRGVGSCTARLRRTATVANAGGQIVVSALCTT